MDLRLLTLGNFDIKRNVNNNGAYRNSDCYFDWIELKRIVSPENIFNNTAPIEHRTELLKNYQSEIGRHLQETMLLFSDEDPEGFPDNTACIYISMINLPIWNEENISAEQYVELKKEVVTKIKQLTQPHTCRLYFSFDHCDCVLVADGAKLSFREYVSTLKTLRNLTVKIVDKDIVAIHDITTIYGYLQNCFEQLKDSDEKLNLVVKLSLKHPSYRSVFEKSINEIDGQEPSAVCIDTIGRYDCIFIWNSISLSYFNKIIAVVHKHTENYFTYCIHMGSEDASTSTDMDNIYDMPSSGLETKAKQKYNLLKQRLTYPPFDEQLTNAIMEVHHSIFAMLNRGFAQYYILSFYESFYSLISFLGKKADLYRQNAPDRKSKENNQKISEQIYNIYRTYFAFLNALNASTMHSERQFLQTDSYQMLYFDAPPKLVAFYTAIANKVVSFTESNTDNEYTFLITPDFKKDIYVESLTNDKTQGKEHNILIIHINEESMYDVPTTLKIIIHEIFHHVGQDENLRKKRYVKYIKCCLAHILSEAMTFEDLKNTNDDDPYLIFKSLVDKIYDKLFDKFADFLESNDWDKSTKNTLYYSEYLTKAFIEFFAKKICEQSDLVKKILEENIICTRNLSGINFEKLSDEDKKVQTRFLSNLLSDQIINNIKTWLALNNYEFAYRTVQHTFRESFADARMLNLLFSDPVEKILSYGKLLSNTTGEKQEAEKIRITSVMRYLSNGNSNAWIDAFEKATLWYKTPDSSENIGIKGLNYYYLSEQVTDYLSNIAPTDKGINEQFTHILETLETDNVGEIVRMIDKEIFAYRKRLLSE